MPYSVDCFRSTIKAFVLQHFSCPHTRILDVGVGAGAGVYADLLRSHYHNLDACEVWKPYIQCFSLTEKYRHVYNENIVHFKFSYYDLIILGDVLEHLTVNDAKNMLARMSTRCRQILVTVPFECEQGVHFGKPYEVHHQDDLCPALMQQRYGSYLELVQVSERDLCQGYEIALYQKKTLSGAIAS